MMDAARERLAFLLETVALEAEHLQATDQRLFAEAFTAQRAATLRDDAMLAERLMPSSRALRGCRTPPETSCCPPC